MSATLETKKFQDFFEVLIFLKKIIDSLQLLKNKVLYEYDDWGSADPITGLSWGGGL